MKGRQHLLVKYSSKREVLRVLSYHREQESAETFGKGEALTVTLNYGLIKTNRPKKSLNTHTSSHACAPQMAGASANAVCTRVLVLESMSNLQCFHHWKVRKLARERENIQTKKSENNNNSVWHD